MLKKLLPFLLLACSAGAVWAQSADVAPVVKNEADPAHLYIPGSYQGWMPNTAPIINAVAGSEKLFEGYVNFIGGELMFKFTNSPDWTHVNYGNAGGDALTTDGLAAGLPLPSEGYYELTADLDKMKWSATKTTWSIIGDATPGGWDTDTPMTYDPAKEIWTVTTSMKAGGSFKFRANNEWKIDLALDEAGNLQYVDNPFFKYNPDLKNPTVPSDGSYVITLDLHTSGKYSFSAVRE